MNVIEIKETLFHANNDFLSVLLGYTLFRQHDPEQMINNSLFVLFCS